MSWKQIATFPRNGVSAIESDPSNGRTWSAFNPGLIAQRINDIVVKKRDVLFAGTYGGVLRSDDDGGTWREVNNGLRDLGVVDMAINDQGDVSS